MAVPYSRKRTCGSQALSFNIQAIGLIRIKHQGYAHSFMMTKTSFLIFALALHCSLSLAKPLKVYILAGQSNMEGHAAIRTFDYIGEDPATAPLLKQMRGPDGNPRVSQRTRISYLTGNDKIKQGTLTVGYGALGSETKIGPEYTFGLAMEAAYDGPILLIKTAWGGKSLNTDFRPPSAGP